MSRRLRGPSADNARDVPRSASVDFRVVPDANATPESAGAAPTGRITRDEVAHLARLARLAVTDAELDVFAGQLDVILGAVARVGEVAAADIPPTSHAVPMTNVFRPDAMVASLPRDAVLAGAPDVEDDKFRVPRILDDQA
jgi:aspartyl-tRNA(Asn)/glutamyl-tRNA(Gln) amidotransferase subunit C